MQEQKTKEGSNTRSEAVGKILESRDIMDSIDAKLEDVKFETRLRPIERIKGDLTRESRNFVKIEDNLRTKDVDNIDNSTIKDSMKSKYVYSDLLDNEEVYSHINSSSILEESQIILHANSNEDSEHEELILCRVEHVVKAEIDDKWDSSRVLECAFGSYGSAKSMYNELEDYVGKSLNLAHNGEHYTVSFDTYEEENSEKYRFLRSALIGSMIGILSSMIGLNPIGTIILAVAIVGIDIYHRASPTTDRYRFESEEAQDGFEVNPSNLPEYSVQDQIEDDIEIRMTEDSVEMHPQSIDTKWVFDKMSNELPDDTAVEFFEDIGLENIEEDRFRATLDRRNTIPTEKHIESVCGKWYMHRSSPDSQFD